MSPTKVLPAKLTRPMSASGLAKTVAATPAICGQQSKKLQNTVYVKTPRGNVPGA